MFHWIYATSGQIPQSEAREEIFRGYGLGSRSLMSAPDNLEGF